MRIDRLLERKHTADCKRVRPTRASRSYILRGVIFCLLVLMVTTLKAGSGQFNASILNTAFASNTCTKSRSENFEAFLNVFINDVDFQRKQTQQIIIVSTLDIAAEPEPKMVKKRIKKHDISFPVMPNNNEIKVRNLNYKNEFLSKVRAKTTLFKADTGVLVTYIFEFRECWFLVEIVDAST